MVQYMHRELKKPSSQGIFPYVTRETFSNLHFALTLVFQHLFKFQLQMVIVRRYLWPL